MDKACIAFTYCYIAQLLLLPVASTVGGRCSVDWPEALNLHAKTSPCGSTWNLRDAFHVENTKLSDAHAWRRRRRPSTRHIKGWHVPRCGAEVSDGSVRPQP